MRMKKIVFLFIIIACLSLFTLLSFASGEQSEPAEKNIVFISGEVSYDRELGMFCFPIGNTELNLCATVMDGMVTTSKVVLQIPEGIEIGIFRNGKEYTAEEGSITKPGSYMVNYQENGSTVQIMTFQIVGEETGKLESYRMPSNFAVESVTKDGETLESDRTVVDFSEEGRYVVEYICVPTGVKYRLKAKIDHTAPTLALKAVVNGSADGPVDISDLEKGAKLVVKRNGKVVNESGTLTKSGNYVVTVSDPAGNTNTYQFTIQVYFNANSIILFIIIIVGLIALLIYIYKARTGLKVR